MNIITYMYKHEFGIYKRKEVSSCADMCLCSDSMVDIYRSIMYIYVAIKILGDSWKTKMKIFCGFFPFCWVSIFHSVKICRRWRLNESFPFTFFLSFILFFSLRKTLIGLCASFTSKFFLFFSHGIFKKVRVSWKEEFRLPINWNGKCLCWTENCNRFIYCTFKPKLFSVIWETGCFSTNWFWNNFFCIILIVIN